MDLIGETKSGLGESDGYESRFERDCPPVQCCNFVFQELITAG